MDARVIMDCFEAMSVAVKGRNAPIWWMWRTSWGWLSVLQPNAMTTKNRF